MVIVRVFGRRRGLFVSTSLPPYTDSQTIRSSYLLGGVTSRDWDWTFVAPGPIPAPGTADWPSEQVVVRTRVPPLLRGRDQFLRVPGSWLASWVVDNAIYRLGVPDMFARWDRLAVEEGLRLHAERPFDVIVSSSGSATAHMAAAKLSQLLGIPWVADYGDPWHLVDREHRPHVAWWSARREPLVIARARNVVFTTEETRAAYINWLGDRLPQSVVLPYGFRRGDVERTLGAPSGDAFEFAHIGAAYTGNRNLVPFIDAVAAVAAASSELKLGVTIVGNHSRAFEDAAAAHGNRIRWTFRDRVPYTESLEWMAKASVLVIIGNADPLQVPGKVFMCLGSARPILYLAQRPLDDDPTAALLSKHAGVRCVPNIAHAIAEAARAMVMEHEALLLAARARAASPAIAAFEAERLSAAFNQLLHEATDEAVC